ncbi:MAG: hypothetical protein D4R56_05380 [Deltaproteobacteria bacterium]|nr:MAG: hypothetical protein D4R56_05380 [Deltaproteobacteria bacterium]
MITCRDPETAVRVLAAVRPDGERVTDIIVAFSDLKSQAALIRKLSAMGIFLDKIQQSIIQNESPNQS